MVLHCPIKNGLALGKLLFMKRSRSTTERQCQKKIFEGSWLTQCLAGLLDNNLIIAERHQDELLDGTRLLGDGCAVQRILCYPACKTLHA